MIKKSNSKKLATKAPGAATLDSLRGATQNTPAARPVTFGVYEPRAQEVFLCGSFNGWSPNATPLTRKENRDWQVTVPLAPGRHEYKFVVDGQWKRDPRASETVSNGLGTLNSVLEVKA
jgi:1,4-alpha-glucan branching enzyme